MKETKPFSFNTVIVLFMPSIIPKKANISVSIAQQRAITLLRFNNSLARILLPL